MLRGIPNLLPHFLTRDDNLLSTTLNFLFVNYVNMAINKAVNN